MDDLRIENPGLQQGLKPSRGRSRETPSFGQAVQSAVQRVGALEESSNRSIEEVLEGRADLHDGMIALQEADLSMRLLLTVRNKVIDAYKEIMRMQF